MECVYGFSVNSIQLIKIEKTKIACELERAFKGCSL